MSNLITKGITPEQKELAESVCRELGISGLRIRYEPRHDGEVAHFRFSQDRRTVAVPEALIQNKRWQDIRFLFRAILNSRTAQENTGSPNEWGEGGEPVS